MTKARFFIKDKVQGVGYRVHIMQKWKKMPLKEELSFGYLNLLGQIFYSPNFR